MIKKIKKQYKSGFSSSPIKVTDLEIDFLIKQNCECSRCGKSIFEMYDFPELLIEDDEIMCEECYDENYRETCPICEESYDTKDFVNDFFVLNEEAAKETKKQPGIYRILERPFFFGNIVSGFESFFDSAIKLEIPLRINEYKKIKIDEGCCEVISDNICTECAEKFLRKENYIKSNSTPCILIKRYENDSLFSDYTPEKLKQSRQSLIHKRITCRGIIERANHIADYGKSGRAKLLKRSISQDNESEQERSTCN
jgi:DNA-directed RNA polymerase subunit RPC12/RpoP